MIETDDDQSTYGVYYSLGLPYTSFNGAVYWIGDKTKYSSLPEINEYDFDLYERLIIMWFHFCEEKFGRTRLPKELYIWW